MWIDYEHKGIHILTANKMLTNDNINIPMRFGTGYHTELAREGLPASAD